LIYINGFRAEKYRRDLNHYSSILRSPAVNSKSGSEPDYYLTMDYIYGNDIKSYYDYFMTRRLIKLVKCDDRTRIFLPSQPSASGIISPSQQRSFYYLFNKSISKMKIIIGTGY